MPWKDPKDKLAYDKKYLKRPEQRVNNAARKRARYNMEKELGKEALTGKDVDHKNGVPTSNARKNLRVMSVSRNRGKH